tara:strand:- start:498 stop:3209 length:2712 start_codon:yes stop_codon:yes gene_type:complete
MQNLTDYLRTKTTKKDEEFTHTRIGDKKKIYGGSYNIPDEDYKEFMDIYYNHVFVKGNKEYLTEKALTPIGKLAIDFDFRYDISITKRQHTPSHIIDMIMLHADELQEIVDIPDGTIIDVFVMHKADVNILKNKTKDGIHVIFDMQMHRALHLHLRMKVLLKLKNMWDDLPITNTWEDVYDKGVSEAFCNWQMYGSRKPDNQAYLVTKHFKLTFNNGECEIQEKEIATFNTKNNLLALSVRNPTQEFPAKNQQIIEDFRKEKNKKAIEFSEESTEIMAKAAQIDADYSGKNPTEVYVELGIKHKIFEKMSQGQNYKMWLNTGFILKNELGDKGENLFVELSRHDSKFVEEDVRAFYNQLNKTNKNESKKPITLASLIKYYKDTDRDIAKIIISEALKIIKIKEVKEKEVSNVELDPSKLDYFDSEYCNSFKSDYLTQKKYFESFVCKVLRPEPQFIYIEGNKDIGKDVCIYCKTSIMTAFEHLSTETVKAETLIETEFIKRWLRDSSVRCYNFLDFMPTNDINVADQENKKIFNLFSGYNPQIKSEYNKENKDKILKPFMDLGRELCGGKQKDFEYFIKFIAHIIQFPAEKIPIAIIFKGKQGTGKTMLLNAIGSLIGQKHYISSSNAKDFFGDYAEGFYHKLIVNMNECEGKNTFDFEGKIKSFISEDRITINPKNVRPSEINNFARTIITTNKANPIPIDVKTGDRRFVVFQTTDFFLDKKYGTIFWKGLLAHFKRPEFIACLYDYLNGLDISKVDWKNERPITEAYKQMCKLYVPIEALFFEYYADKHKGCIIETPRGSTWETEFNPRNKEVYDDYVKFCKANGFSNDIRFVACIRNFNNRCEELEIPHRVIKSSGNNEFRFTPSEVNAHLLKKKWINREIDDPEIVPIDEKGEEFVFEI